MLARLATTPACANFTTCDPAPAPRVFFCGERVVATCRAFDCVPPSELASSCAAPSAPRSTLSVLCATSLCSEFDDVPTNDGAVATCQFDSGVVGELTRDVRKATALGESCDAVLAAERARGRLLALKGDYDGAKLALAPICALAKQVRCIKYFLGSIKFKC